MTKKIAVLGTGANGMAIGADLARAGHDVVLIDQWPENVAAMRQRGARIEMPDEVLEVPVRAYNLCDVCTFTEKFDTVLILVKAYDARWAAWLIEPYLNPTTMMADPAVYPCLGNEFGPVKVPDGRLWVMGDNRTHSADSRAHCTSTPTEAQKGILCTGDPMTGTVPVSNVIGKARFIAWPPSRWGGVSSFDPQRG